MTHGNKRFRQAIQNQRDLGNGEFRLAFADAEAICKECEDELARLAWAVGVPAPVDKDGEAVPLTTRVMFFGDSQRDVTGFYYSPDDGWRLRTTTLTTLLRNFRLHRPDSWERLEEDIDRMVPGKERPNECYYFDEDGAECPECPARNSESCSRYVARDVMRRAKALAGRDAKEVADD